MAEVDLSKFTDRDLIELEKKISKEKNLRKQKDSIVYKCNLNSGFVNDIMELTDMYIKEHGFDNLSVNFMSYYPSTKMEKSIFTLCDYTLGNYKVSESPSHKRVPVLSCNGSRLLIENKEDYKEMYDELCSVVKKWIEKEKDYISEKKRSMNE